MAQKDYCKNLTSFPRKRSNPRGSKLRGPHTHTHTNTHTPTQKHYIKFGLCSCSLIYGMQVIGCHGNVFEYQGYQEFLRSYGNHRASEPETVCVRESLFVCATCSVDSSVEHFILWPAFVILLFLPVH